MEEKKRIDTWYFVSLYLVLFIFTVILLCGAFASTEPLIVYKFVGLVICGLVTLKVLLRLADLIGLAIENRYSGFMVFLEGKVERNWNNYENEFVLPIGTLLHLYGVSVVLQMASPNCRPNFLGLEVITNGIREFLHMVSPNYHPNFQRLEEIVISGMREYSYEAKAILFAFCFLMSTMTMFFLMVFVCEILCRIVVHRMSTTFSVNTLVKLEKLFGKFPQVFLALNMFCFAALYTYVASCPIHMKGGIFAAYLSSFFVLFVIVKLNEPNLDEGKLVESLDLRWNNLVESPGWKKSKEKIYGVNCC